MQRAAAFRGFSNWRRVCSEKHLYYGQEASNFRTVTLDPIITFPAVPEIKLKRRFCQNSAATGGVVSPTLNQENDFHGEVGAQFGIC